MDKKKWQRIEALFNAAVKLPAAQREAYLNKVDEPSDVTVAVRDMLRAEANGSRTINDVIREAGEDLDPETIVESEIWLGRRVGVYEITEHIANGGMGAVYVAERADDAFRQRVAVKLLAAGLASSDARPRFLGERQILADLSHPNIAQLIDGGATEEGVPYLVMEFIDGVAIDEYCDNNRLTIDERLRLFQKVCDAVQYAHRRLIIHRDIKPSNILVTADGTPKLLDFGVAKLMEADHTSTQAALAVAQKRWLTPETASPEQIRGEAVTTACDVYALGVLLYRLVSGHPPYHLTTLTHSEIMRVVCDTVTRRPSDVVTDAKVEATSGATDANQTVAQISSARSISAGALRKRLRGDIDNIVLVAMHKDANRRYATVALVAARIDRDLEEWGSAEQRFVRVLAAAPNAFGPRDPMTARTMAEFGYSKLATDNAADALRLSSNAVQMLEADRASSNTAMVHWLHGEVLLALHDHGNAVSALREALRQGETYLGADHWQLDFIRSSLGQALLESGELQNGDVLLRAAEERLVAVRPATDRYRRIASQRVACSKGSTCDRSGGPGCITHTVCPLAHWR